MAAQPLTPHTETLSPEDIALVERCRSRGFSEYAIRELLRASRAMSELFQPGPAHERIAASRRALGLADPFFAARATGGE